MKQTARAFANALLKMDFFGEKPELKVKGEATFPTWNGLLVSLLVLGLTLRYGYEKLGNMLNHADTNYTSATESDALDIETVFNSKQFDASMAIYLSGTYFGLY